MKRRVVLDTDTFNEVDDQFALAHLLLSQDQIGFEAVYAAPFAHQGMKPGEGMEQSYEEIHRVIERVNGVARPPAFRGSRSYLPGPSTPVESEAARDLIERAMSGGEKLHVAAIAAATNVASALLLEPRIAERIVIVWLGGHAPYWPHTREFNLGQDLHASRVLLGSPAPLVLLPCVPVTSHLLVTVPELEKELAPFSRLGAYLTDTVTQYRARFGAGAGWSKEIWDISASAFVVNPAWIECREMPSPILKDDVTWGFSASRHSIQVADRVDRNAIFSDFFAKARKADG